MRTRPVSRLDHRPVSRSVSGDTESGKPTGPIDDLFADGGKGVWYDPTDRSTLFQDHLGTVPVTAVGQHVGLVLDKSGNGNHLMLYNGLYSVAEHGVNYIEFDGYSTYGKVEGIGLTGEKACAIWYAATAIDSVDNAMFLELNKQHMPGNPTGAVLLLIPGGPRPGGNMYANFVCTGDGAGNESLQTVTYDMPVAPTTFVGALDIVHGERVNIRMNLAQVATRPLMDAVFDEFPFWVGRKYDDRAFFGGRLYQLVLKVGQQTQETVEAIELEMTKHVGALGPLKFKLEHLFRGRESGSMIDIADVEHMFTSRTSNINPKPGDKVGLIVDGSMSRSTGRQQLGGVNGGPPFGSNNTWATDAKEPFELVDGEIVIKVQTVTGYLLRLRSQINLSTWTVYEIRIKGRMSEPLASGGIRAVLIGGSGQEVASSTRQRLADNNGYVSMFFMRGSADYQVRLVIDTGNHPDDVGKVFTMTSASIAPVNGKHLVQDDDSKRPVYRTDGTHHWLEFDGTASLDSPNGSWDGNTITHYGVTMFAATESNSGAPGLLFNAHRYDKTSAVSLAIPGPNEGKSQFVVMNGEEVNMVEAGPQLGKVISTVRYSIRQPKRMDLKVGPDTAATETLVPVVSSIENHSWTLGAGVNGEPGFIGRLYGFILRGAYTSDAQADQVREILSGKADIP